MTDKTNDILVDYEGLCGQLSDVISVLEMAIVEDKPATTMAVVNVVVGALNDLQVSHSEITETYRKGLSCKS